MEDEIVSKAKPWWWSKLVSIGLVLAFIVGGAFVFGVIDTQILTYIIIGIAVTGFLVYFISTKTTSNLFNKATYIPVNALHDIPQLQMDLKELGKDIEIVTWNSDPPHGEKSAEPPIVCWLGYEFDSKTQAYSKQIRVFQSRIVIPGQKRLAITNYKYGWYVETYKYDKSGVPKAKLYRGEQMFKPQSAIVNPPININVGERKELGDFGKDEDSESTQKQETQ